MCFSNLEDNVAGNFFCCHQQLIIHLEQKNLFKSSFFTNTHSQSDGGFKQVSMCQHKWSGQHAHFIDICTQDNAKYIFDLHVSGFQRRAFCFCISCVSYISVFETSCPNQTSNGIRLVNKHISSMSICQEEEPVLLVQTQYRAYMMIFNSFY